MIKLSPGDLRRAAALAVHHGHRDEEGANTILQEAVAAGRLTELILGILTVYSTLVPLLHTEAGLVLLHRAITDMAAQEEQDGNNEERQNP